MVRVTEWVHMEARKARGEDPFLVNELLPSSLPSIDWAGEVGQEPLMWPECSREQSHRQVFLQIG